MLSGKLKLRTLLIGLSTGGIVLSSTLLLGSFSLLQKSNIERSLLEGNLAYARKLADSVDRHLNNAQRELKWSAEHIDEVNDSETVKREIDRLQSSAGFFNSVAVVSAERIIVYASPTSLQTGIAVHSKNSIDATTLKKPLISEPYTTNAGNYAIVISYPVFNNEKKYIGYIGGTIYLKKQSMLSDILSQHYYDNKTEVSIISNKGGVIYSSNKEKIGYQLELAQEVKNTILTESIGYFYNDFNGVGTLTGYSRMKKTDWNIFITTPPERVTVILLRTVKDAFWIMLSIIMVMLLIVIFISWSISSPLEKLAKATGSKDPTETLAVLPEINTWYAEAVELREAVYQHVLMMFRRVNSLKEEAITDPLTGVLNRRGFNKMAATYEHCPFRCMIAIDIDHFKRVNDTFGHEAGDEVLVSFAGLLKEQCRSHDVISRFGGEEFIILLPDTSLKEAFLIAERIRKVVEITTLPFAGRITMSAGVCGGTDNENLLKYADEALYRAKRTGRNRSCIWQGDAR